MSKSESPSPDIVTTFSKFFGSLMSYQLGMMATSIPAQPVITNGLRLSAKSAIEGESYVAGLRSLQKIPPQDLARMFGLGYFRRSTSAFPVAASIMAAGDSLDVDPVSRSVLSSVIETFLARNSDPKETFAVVNSGASEAQIASRQALASVNKPSVISLLAVRNLFYALAIYSINPAAKVMKDEYGDHIKSAAGFDDEQLDTFLKHSLRVSCCAATAPIQNLYVAFASGQYSSIPASMFKPQNLFKGGAARIGALYAATLSIGEGIEVARKYLSPSSASSEQGKLKKEEVEALEAAVKVTKEQTLPDKLSKDDEEALCFVLDSFTRHIEAETLPGFSAKPLHLSSILDDQQKAEKKR
jgi:hypothetical protein